MRRFPLIALIFSFLVAFVSTVNAESFVQTLPDAPAGHHQPIGRTDWSLLAADASARALDIYSTHWMLQQGDHEMFLPDAISHHVPVMAAYSAGVVALDWFAMRKLERKRPRLAHLILASNAVQDGFWALRNLTLKPDRR